MNIKSFLPLFTLLFSAQPSALSFHSLIYTKARSWPPSHSFFITSRTTPQLAGFFRSYNARHIAMRLLPSLSFLSTFLLVSSVSDVALANNHGARGFGGSLLHRHHAAPPSDALIVRDTNTHLAKRFEDCRFTYYAAGLGACGKTNSGSDFVSTS